MSVDRGSYNCSLACSGQVSGLDILMPASANSFFSSPGFILAKASKVVTPAAFKAALDFGPMPAMTVRSSSFADTFSTASTGTDGSGFNWIKGGVVEVFSMCLFSRRNRFLFSGLVIQMTKRKTAALDSTQHKILRYMLFVFKIHNLLTCILQVDMDKSLYKPQHHAGKIQKYTWYVIDYI